MVFLSFRRRVHLKHLRILLCWLAKDLISYQWNSVKSLTWPTCFGWEFLFTWTIFVLFETLPLENLISVGSFLIHFHLYGVFYFLEGLSFFLTPFHLSHSFRLGGFFHNTWTTFVLYETLPLNPPLLYEKSGLTFTPDGFICLRFRKQFGVKVKMSWWGLIFRTGKTVWSQG